jgi:dipeptidase E
MPKEPQIVAMGGGGFSMEPENLSLDNYVLSLVATDRPKVSFVPTASGDSDTYVERFYTSFRTLPCEPTHLSLFHLNQKDLRSHVLQQDLIYVGGGSTRNLLVLWREWGLDTLLREAWAAGIVLAGISAGSICWFQEGGKIKPGYASDDGAALHFVGQNLVRCITSRPAARTYRVERAGNEVKETTIVPTLLTPAGGAQDYK